MNASKVSSLVEALLCADLDAADRDQVAAIVGQSRQVRSWLDAVDVRCARRTKALAAQGRAESSDSLLGDGGRRSGRDAIAVGHRETICEAMPGFEHALANGNISAGHLDAIANVTRNLDSEIRDELFDLQAALLVAATSERIEQFERTVRDLKATITTRNGRSDSDELDRQRAASKIKRWVDKATGMHHTHVTLDPVRDTILHTALDAHLRRVRARNKNSGRPWNQLELDAFINAITSGITRTPPATLETSAPSSTSSGTGPDDTRHEPATVDTTNDAITTDARTAADADDVPIRPGERVEPIPDPPPQLRVPEIGILIDHHSLLHGAHQHGICETHDGVPIPISTARRFCCDAEIYPAVLNRAGELTDLGRSKRTINRAQRRALRAMHRTCSERDCQVPFDHCRIHHVRFWTRDHGRSDIDNLLPLCEQHHHLVHEGGWTLTMTPDRIATWTRPDGTTHHTGTTIDRAPHGIAPPISGEHARNANERTVGDEHAASMGPQMSTGQMSARAAPVPLCP